MGVFKKPVCEKCLLGNNCVLTQSIGQFQRMGDERIGWDKEMSIDLCDKHSNNHIPAHTRMMFVEGKLILKLIAKKGFKLRKRRISQEIPMRHLIEKKGLKYHNVLQRIYNGATIKQAISKKTNSGRLVIAIKKQTGDSEVFKSGADAERAIGINRKRIYAVLGGKKKSTHGYIFKYAS